MRRPWLALAILAAGALLTTTRRRRPSAAHDFARRYARALADPRLATNLLAFQRAWAQSRDAAFADLAAVQARLAVSRGETAPTPALAPSASGSEVSPPTPTLTPAAASAFAPLRAEMALAKDRTLADLPTHVAQFRAAAERAGAVVVEAVDAEAANVYVAALATRRGARLVVKSKSMVSEELELNHHLAARGIEVVETDLGEWIVQLAGERPSHMVMPAIHKSRQQVGELFTRVLGREISHESVPEQVGVARTELRQRFLDADIGISGANALIAESGTVMLVTNEGNGRLVTSLPPVHVVLVGYEKLVPTFADAMRQLRLLARSATAQTITSYTTFITGPDRPGKELHIVLVDNGRLAMREDAEFRSALRCIRCAACADVCPPYQVVGGHVFGYIYSGAIGLVNTPFHHGLAHAAGPQSLCVSCNACATVCPVEIPLPRQILTVRARVAARYGLAPWKRAVLALWARPGPADLAMRATARLSAPLADGGLLRRLPLPARFAWRTPPAPAARPARDRLARLRAAVAGARTGQPAVAASPTAAPATVACFLQCVADRFCPEVVEATVQVLEACGERVVVPRGQHCCGLPAIDAGDLATARTLARQTIRALEAVPTRRVVTPGASCAIAIRHDYADLFRHDRAWRARAEAVAARVLDLASYLKELGQLPPLAPFAGPSPATAYHPFCQSTNVLGLEPEPRALLADYLGLDLRTLPEATVCCGFGGSTSLEHPDVARQIVTRKLDNVAASGAEVLITDNPGCLLHLRGAAAGARRPLRVRHLAEVLAERLTRDGGPDAR